MALVFLAVLAVNAQDYQEPQASQVPQEDQYHYAPQDFQNIQNPKHPNTRLSVYLHPVALVAGLDMGIPMIYSTVEIPFNLFNALIVKPSLWINNSFLGETKFYRAGSDFGLRHYPSGRGEGLYLQPQFGAFYLSIKDWDWGVDFEEGDNTPKTKGSAFWYDFTGYFGYSYKFAYISIYSDTGVGYGCISGVCSLIYDLNFGIGIPF